MTSLFFLPLLLFKAATYIKTHKTGLTQTNPQSVSVRGHMWLGATGQSFFSYCRDIRVRGKHHLNRCSSEMQKRSRLVSPPIRWQRVVKFTWCLSPFACQLVATKLEGGSASCNLTTGEKITSVSNQRSTERQCSTVMHGDGGGRGVARLESCIRYQVALKCLSGVAGERHWHDLLSPLLNPFLVLSLLFPLKKLKMSFRGPLYIYLKLFVNPLLKLGLHQKWAARSNEPELWDRPYRVCITCTPLKIVTVFF